MNFRSPYGPLMHFQEPAPATPPAGTPAPPAATPSLTGTAPQAPLAGDPAKPADPVIPDPAKSVDPAKPGEPEKKDDPAPAPFALEKAKLPEGMKADDPLTKSFAELMSDDKLSGAERGQKLLDLYATATKTARDATTEAWNAVNKEWETKTLADKEIGGAKWPTTKATIAKAIDSLGPELAASVREALDITGAGNHPAITKAFHAFASKLTEGGHVAGNPPGHQPSVKEAFYPNSPDMK